MTDTVPVWQPLNRPSLAVPFPGLVMKRQIYQALLEGRLHELIEADPSEAKRLLTASSEHSPDLYRIAMSSPPQDWPSQILTCDQMQMCLDRIDWQKGSRESLSPSQMPSLAELLEAI